MARCAACQKTAPSPAAVRPTTVAETTGFLSFDDFESSLDSLEFSVEFSVDCSEEFSEDSFEFESLDESEELLDESPESLDESPEPLDESPESWDESPEPSDEPSEFDESPCDEFPEPSEEFPESEPSDVANAPVCSDALIPPRPVDAGVWHPITVSEIPIHASFFHREFFMVFRY